MVEDYEIWWSLWGLRCVVTMEVNTVEKFKVADRKKKRIEMLIRVIDCLIYFVVIVGGLYALFFTPNTVTKELAGFEWMIPWWAGLLIVGGGLGLIGRITTIWILEPAADVASAFGILIYFVVIGTTAFSSITAALASCLVFVAFLGVTRRYLELQLFGSDPTQITFRQKVQATLERRIPNVTPRG